MALENLHLLFSVSRIIRIFGESQKFIGNNDFTGLYLENLITDAVYRYFKSIYILYRFYNFVRGAVSKNAVFCCNISAAK